MNPTPSTPKSASNWHIFKCWVKHQWSRAFSSNRKTVVLNDPQKLIAEVEAAGADPYSQISRRKVTSNPAQKTSFQRVHKKDIFQKAHIEITHLDGTAKTKAELLNELRQQITENASLIHRVAYKQGTLEDFQACNALLRALKREDWQETLTLINHHSTGLFNSLSHLSNALSLLTTGSKPALSPTNAEAVRNNEQAQWNYLGRQVHLETWDITQINSNALKARVIVCPHASRASRKEHEVNAKLQSMDPILNNRLFRQRIRKLKPGMASIRQSQDLQSQGFTHIIDTTIPAKNALEANKKTINAYQSAIQAAHLKGEIAIAIPILTTGQGIPPNRSASLAYLAIKRYLANSTIPGKPPVIHLVCPPTPEGQEIQQIVERILDMKQE